MDTQVKTPSPAEVENAIVFERWIESEKAATAAAIADELFNLAPEKASGVLVEVELLGEDVEVARCSGVYTAAVGGYEARHGVFHAELWTVRRDAQGRGIATWRVYGAEWD